MVDGATDAENLPTAAYCAPELNSHSRWLLTQNENKKVGAFVSSMNELWTSLYIMYG